MQTFLPLPSFEDTAKILDYRRLGKQRVEAYQILNILIKNTKTNGWRNHPAVKMWVGYEDALGYYMNTMITEWVNRGYNNSMKYYDTTDIEIPPWVGFEPFHASHRSNLLRKDPVYYSKFNWNEDSNLEYIWPIE